MSTPRATGIALLSFLLVACSRGEAPSRGDAAPVGKQTAPLAEAPKVTAGDTASECPHTGLWAVCSVERRLRQSGFVAKQVEGKAPARPGFSVKPRVYTLGRARLEIFIYATASELDKDMAGLDTVLVVPRGSTAVVWESTPTLIRSANLAAVVVTSSPRQAERLALALTAGAPQPGSPR